MKAIKLGGALTLINGLGYRHGNRPHSSLGGYYIKIYGINLSKSRRMFCDDCEMKKECLGWKGCPFRQDAEFEIKKELRRRDKRIQQRKHDSQTKNPGNTETAKSN